MNRFLPLSAAIALAFGATAFAADGNGTMDQPPGAADPQFSFEQLDTNGDGSLSREEAAAAGLNIDWGTADKDGSGALTREEYEGALRGGSGLEGGGGPGGSGFGTEDGGGIGGGDSGSGGMDGSGGSDGMGGTGGGATQ
jgi:hypothetical protein